MPDPTRVPTEVPADAPDRIEQLARMAALVLWSQRATAIEVLEIGPLCSYADYFVLATGETRTQLRAFAEGVEQAMESNNVYKLGLEGKETGGWILLDYGDVIVQLFEPEAREFYQIEELWTEAPRLDWQRDLPEGASEHLPESEEFYE